MWDNETGDVSGHLERLRSVLRAAPIGVGMVIHRVIQDVNDYLCQMVGYDRGELIGRNARLLYESQEEYERVGRIKYGQIAQGQVGSLETRWRCKDGRLLDILLSSAPVDAADLSKGVTFTVVDITPHKQVEHRLRLNEKRLDALLSLSQMKEASEQDLLTYALERAQELTDSSLGYLALLSEDERTLHMHAWSRTAMEECRVPCRQLAYRVEETGLWGEAVRQRKPIITNDYAADSPWKRGCPAGHVAVRRHMNVPLIEGGRVVLIAGVGNKDAPYDDGDVKQLALLMNGLWALLKAKRADEALRESERRRTQLYDSMTEAVALHEMVYDEQGRAVDYRITDCNPAYTRITGIAREQAVGRLASAVYGTGQAPYLDSFAEVARSGRPLEMEIFFEPMRKYFRVSVFSPGPGSFATVTTDITLQKVAEAERRNLEAQVQHAQKLESLGVLAGGIAHDFNNLLTAVLGNADLALAEMSHESPGRECIQEISRVARRAADLCRQMLAYSGKGKFQIETLDLSRLVEEMSHMLEVSISKKAVLKYKFAPHLPSVEGDATQIRQIVMNLIVNASEAIGDRSGVIAVSTGMMECDKDYLDGTYMNENLPEGSYVYLEVADTGCGMDRETMVRVFDPFFSTKFAGRGLGLAAVLGIVRGHGGAIKVYSEPGKGTTFKVLLPASPRAALAPSEPAPAETWRGQGTVLVVDDEETIRALARRMIEHLGLQVLTAPDGREAVRLYRQHQDVIRCVLLDLTMPHMDGEETFRELRRIRGDIRVLLSSGYSEQDITQRFVGKGLAGFVQKPYRLDDLTAKLREAMGA